MNFYEAIRGYSQDRIDKLESTFDLWSELSDRGREIVINIREREHFLAQNAWDLFLENILIHEYLINNDHDKDKYEKKYENTCYREIFKTEEVISKREIINNNLYNKLGNSVDKESFKNNFIRENSKSFNELQEINTVVEKLFDYMNNGLTHTNEEILLYSSFKIRPFMMWATWDVHSDEPFAFLSTEDPDEVNLCLALGNLQDEFKLLLIYDFEGILYKSTVIDAALRNYYFQPPELDFADYGFTNPHHTDLNSISVRLEGRYGENGYSREPRPEGIHNPITIQHLIDGNVQKLPYL